MSASGYFTNVGHRGCTPHTPGCTCSVGPDTRLYWKEGNDLKFGTIEDLFLAYQLNPIDREEFSVLSGYRSKKVRAGSSSSYWKFSASSVEIGFSRIKDVMYHGVRPVWRVELRNGKYIEITESHSVFGPKDTKSAYYGLLVPKKLDELDKVVSVDKHPRSAGKHIDYDKSTFMGLWMADGSYFYYHKNRAKPAVQISTGNNRDIVKWIKHFSKKYSVLADRGAGKMNGTYTKVLHYSPNRKGGDCVLSSIMLGREIHDAFGEVDSYTKRVPREIFTADEQSVCSFLRGYFSGDGCLLWGNNHRDAQVACVSVSRPLLEDVSVLLDRIGVKHTIRLIRRGGGLMMGKWQQRQLHELMIAQGAAVNRFMDVVGFIQRQKNKPFIRRKIFRDRKRRPVSMREIRKIEYVGEKPVYDISVESEAFVANGILSHNTDTMKCNQVNHPEWWPKPGECRPDLSSYGQDFYPTTNCSGCAGPDQRFCTYGGPRGRIGTGSGAGCTSCKGDFWHYYAPTNPAYRNFPARHCATTCNCTRCANQPISSNCQGVDNTTGAMCDCSFGNMRAGCWDNNCTGGNSTCDCTRCANMPISSRCKGIDSRIPGLACDCGLPDANVCWNYNCCYQGQSAPGPGGPARVSNRPPRLGRNIKPVLSTPSGPGTGISGGGTSDGTVPLLLILGAGLIGLLMLSGVK